MAMADEREKLILGAKMKLSLAQTRRCSSLVIKQAMAHANYSSI